MSILNYAATVFIQSRKKDDIQQYISIHSTSNTVLGDRASKTKYWQYTSSITPKLHSKLLHKMPK